MVFLLFKQKTAYEMRISDCSSDVCSSDLSHFDVIRELATADRTNGPTVGWTRIVRVLWDKFKVNYSTNKVKNKWFAHLRATAHGVAKKRVRKEWTRVG